ncbi:MAG: TIGR01440 family protein [Clostridiales bacterium]|nr:TIGR01440 family protein [Clostridiales bacterium]
MENLKIKNECEKAVEELISVAKLKKGSILVVGCSTSEVLGDKIGTNSDVDTAKEIFDGIYNTCLKHGVNLAVQCCEHLNRAIVIDADAVTGYDIVNVIPQKKAGGSLATVAYENFNSPAVIEEIRADAGMDIGNTLIGMHLKKVAVPVRLSMNKIGKANVVFARVRPKFIGGIRAIYNPDLL